MTSEKHTGHYGLTQYSDNGKDTVSFLGDYNHDMSVIDAKLKSLEDRIANLEKVK